jgi:uncharacterized membrane protein
MEEMASVHLIYLLLSIGLILFNLTGLTALATRQLPMVASARASAVIGLVLLTFALEHFVGFGKLSWLWPLTTAGAAWAIHGRRDWRANRHFWSAELVFALGFAYGFAWRFAFPDIDASSEHLTDLYFISNFLSGQTLPAADRWLAGGVFDFYYAFQHYAAALLARLFGLEAGLAMNLSWAVSIGFLASLAWEIASHFIGQRWLRTALVITLLLGGNGLSPLMPLMIDDSAEIDARAAAVNRIWESTRFSGMFDERVNTPLGEFVAGNPKAPEFTENLELPLETVAYLSYLGDFHPPLGSLVLLLLTLALSLNIAQRKDATGAAPRNTNEALPGVALGLTLPLVLVTNTWIFPLQFLLLLSWLVFRRRTLAAEWRPLLLGGLLGFALIYPFLTYFASASLATHVAWIKPGGHTPPAYFLALHWPLLLLIASGLGLSRRVPWAGWLALTLAGLLVMSELIYVDDPMGGKYERFNTTLKWWSWLWPAALVGLGSVVIGRGGRLGQLVGSLMLAALLTYALPIAAYWRHSDKPHIGKMAGDGWLRQDDIESSMLTHLKNSPDGVVLESLEQGAYSASSALALNASKGVVLGWADHVAQWRGSPSYVPLRHAAIRAIYRGQLADAPGWLNQYQVRYFVWSLADEQRAPGVRQQLNEIIGHDFSWRSFYQNGEQQVGIWERRGGR